ncbi:MAG: hypothetical protein WC073_11395 [Sterolibacterium sp.]
MRTADAVLLLLGLVLAWSFYRAHLDKTSVINLFDLVMDGGRLSKMSCVFMGAFAALTWIMIRLTLDGKMTEGFFTAYGAIWVAPLVAKLFSPAPTPGTTTITDTSKTTTKTIEDAK